MRLAVAVVPLVLGASWNGRSETAPGPSPESGLTLAECIALAVRNGLTAERLDRLSQKLTLADAEAGFRLKPQVNVTVDRGWTANESGRNETSSYGVSPGVTLDIPTGGNFDLSVDSTVTGERTASQAVRLTFTQPLLKGGGTEVGTAALVSARRAERSNVLAFEASVIGIVTKTIGAYWSVVRSTRAVEIAGRSLQRARDLLAVNRVLVETGRMAEQDIVQTEASIAERELSLSEARDALSDANRALIDILNIDSGTRIRPTETPRVERKTHDADRSVELALQNRTDYRSALLAVEGAASAVALADNSRKWDLSLSASARVGNTGDTLSDAYSRFDEDYRVGLNLNIPLGEAVDAGRRHYQRAKIALKKARLRVSELRRSIDVEVRAAVRDVRTRFRRVELARRAREFAQRKLEVERIKLNAGLTTNFRLVRLEDDLVRSQNTEVDATIAYLNALTGLDRTLGTTLDTWRIEIDAPAEGVADK